MEVKHPSCDECKAAELLVQAVVDEVYGGLWATPPVPIGATDWCPAWVALDEGELIGVALTAEEWIEDLWVAAKARGGGSGSALLSRCETEIRERGFRYANLRVVSSNSKAIRFYEARAWKAEREFQHESLPVTMLEMRKSL